MTGFVRNKFADQAVAKQVQVTNGIEYLVLDEFVFVAKTVLINT